MSNEIEKFVNENLVQLCKDIREQKHISFKTSPKFTETCFSRFVDLIDSTRTKFDSERYKTWRMATDIVHLYAVKKVSEQ